MGANGISPSTLAASVGSIVTRASACNLVMATYSASWIDAHRCSRAIVDHVTSHRSTVGVVAPALGYLGRSTSKVRDLDRFGMLAAVATAGSGLIFLACFWGVIAAAVFSVQPILEGTLSLHTTPWAGWVLWLVVALPSLLQIRHPGLYEAWYRSASAVLDDGQWWRTATALLVQDGGIAGTTSNLILLAVALLLCLPLWGARATVLTFLFVGVGLNFAAVLAGAGDGAGNSGATLPLLASLPPLAFAVLPDRRWRAVVGALVTSTAAIVLIVGNDGHGIAVLVGLMLGLLGMPYARWRARAGLLPHLTDPSAFSS